MTMIPSLGVVALVGLIGLESQSYSREPHPIVVGLYNCLIGPYLDSGSPYQLSPPGGAVLSTHHSVGMMFVWSEGIDVPSVVVLVE